MKTVRWLLLILLLASLPATAGSLEGQGTASAKAVLYFAGTHAIGTLDGTFELNGQLTLETETIPFSASGWVQGEGEGETDTLDVEAWATFAVRGATEDGRDLAVQGGLTLSGLSASSSSTSGSGTGTFFATVFIDGEQYYTQGDAKGSATGGFVPPEDPYSMELAGQGTFSLTGTLEIVPAESSDPEKSSPNAAEDEPSIASVLPWESDAWPEGLLAQLLHILTHDITVEESP